MTHGVMRYSIDRPCWQMRIHRCELDIQGSACWPTPSGPARFTAIFTSRFPTSMAGQHASVRCTV